MRIGISCGDPNGIGPEITLKACAALGQEAELIPICDAAFLRQQAEVLDLPVPATIMDDAPVVASTPGAITEEGGRASAAWVDRGIRECLNGNLDALVTAPISKEAWHKAGIPFPGHTELLADRCGTPRFGMLLFGGQLRVMLATRHLPLREVADALGEAEIRLAVELLEEGLPLLGVGNPSIAICGLNPHAGDGGTLGSEEQEWIEPLIAQMQSEGHAVSGPHPADTVFYYARKGDYDAVVAMYHDQGLAPLKCVAFDSGVNATLGLPLIRTSPDHGTAFGIAGTGTARPDSMIEAVRAAIVMGSRENPWKHPSN